MSLRIDRGVLAGVVGQRRLHQGAHPLDLLGLDLQVGELALDDAGQRGLVDQHAGVGQRQPLAGVPAASSTAAADAAWPRHTVWMSARTYCMVS